MRQYIKNWQKQLEERQKQSDLINRRETALHSLLVGVTTEESLRLAEEVSSLFQNAIEKRLNDINKEKELIERWKQK